MAKTLIVTALVYAIGEGIGIVLFWILRRLLGSNDAASTLKFREICKGMLERIVLLTGLIQNLPQIIIAFGALKIGTRLHSESNTQTPTNEFFLIGNLLSILIALIDLAAIRYLSS